MLVIHKFKYMSLGILLIGCMALDASDEEILNAICESAREHMPPELAACEDLECVENLLYTKEESLALLTFVGNGMSVESGLEFMKVYRGIKDDHKQLIEASPIQQYETKRLDRDTLDTTRWFLEQSGMNPRKVKIAGRRMSSKDPSSGRAKSAHTKTPATIEYPQKHREVPSLHVIAHEVTHLDEAHPLKQEFTRDCAQAASQINIFAADKADKHYTFSRLGRMHEMQADLLPLIRFEDPQIMEQLLEQRMPECVHWYKQGNLHEVWNLPVSILPTHAGCAEELPYILKINELKMRGAKPKYEKS